MALGYKRREQKTTSTQTFQQPFRLEHFSIEASKKLIIC